MTPHSTAGTPGVIRHAAALRWVAGQLAWEDRLETLREDSEALPETLDAPVPSPRVAARCAPIRRSTPRATPRAQEKPAA